MGRDLQLPWHPRDLPGRLARAQDPRPRRGTRPRWRRRHRRRRRRPRLADGGGQRAHVQPARHHAARQPGLAPLAAAHRPHQVQEPAAGRCGPHLLPRRLQARRPSRRPHRRRARRRVVLRRQVRGAAAAVAARRGGARAEARSALLGRLQEEGGCAPPRFSRTLAWRSSLHPFSPLRTRLSFSPQKEVARSSCQTPPPTHASHTPRPAPTHLHRNPVPPTLSHTHARSSTRAAHLAICTSTSCVPRTC